MAATVSHSTSDVLSALRKSREVVKFELKENDRKRRRMRRGWFMALRRYAKRLFSAKGALGSFENFEKSMFNDRVMAPQADDFDAGEKDLKVPHDSPCLESLKPPRFKGSNGYDEDNECIAQRYPIELRLRRLDTRIAALAKSQQPNMRFTPRNYTLFVSGRKM